jgi:hypothetical protein
MVRLDREIVGDCLMVTISNNPTSNCVALPGNFVDSSRTSNLIDFGCLGLALIKIRLVFGVAVICNPLRIG